MQAVKVYLDLPLLGALMGWAQDATLLWMVAQISGVRVNFGRLVLGGAIGGVFQFILLANQASAGILNPWILSPLFFLVIIPLVMVLITFLPVNHRKIIRILGYFYLLSFLLSGIHWGIDSLNERFFHWQITLFWRFCLHLTLILLLGEMGWGIVHRKIWEQISLYPIQIDWNGQQVKLNALLDTGNRLHDPLTKAPVIIIELNRIQNFLPKEVLELTASFSSPDLPDVLDLPEFWVERVRVLPFHSLGRDHGILIGFRPDRLTVWQKQQETIHKNVVVALYNRPLSPEGVFQALIPPAVLKQS
ncbi:MAG: sigma-E processing peptidase SpoIIGA [Bacillota bacterium]